jgi:ABC-2 type transport system permease protein
MFSLIKKEINAFFSSLIGYLVVVVFLTLCGLFLWVFPGDYNILDMGYAGLDNLFILAPWVFMFLIPAVTMRILSDEVKTGTFELLLTKPLSDFQIVFAKYISAVVIVCFALLPTLVYYYSTYQLGQQAGNIDQGGTLGSYFGLILLASSYSAIGIFCSSLTENQIVSFIFSLVLCFVFYLGFDSASALGSYAFANIVEQIGINAHYQSMSRGVVDSRDLVYFLGLIAIFLSATQLVLKSRKW